MISAIQNELQSRTASAPQLSLLTALTQNLRLCNTDEELGSFVLEWLPEQLTATGFAVYYLSRSADRDTAGKYKWRGNSILLPAGAWPFDETALTTIVTRLNLSKGDSAIVVDPTTQPDLWRQDEGISQVMIAPIWEADQLFGYLAACSANSDPDFEPQDIELLTCLATLLGIHSSNRALYRQQADWSANIIRALVSAIDAKDPYTCGHSDRVARYAVRIALEMRCGPRLLNTIYLAGLLHDVGKIGIYDQILRKTERLNEAEYEHIKMHPHLGHRILADLRQLSEVLPGVLHHHEQWNGGGYPQQLRGARIPLIARILAVADAYDAMTSDRPYRKGMPVEKVDDILRKGAGEQWDPTVVDAYFLAKHDIEQIGRQDRAQRRVLDQEWL